MIRTCFFDSSGLPVLGGRFPLGVGVCTGVLGAGVAADEGPGVRDLALLNLAFSRWSSCPECPESAATWTGSQQPGLSEQPPSRAP